MKNRLYQTLRTATAFLLAQTLLTSFVLNGNQFQTAAKTNAKKKSKIQTSVATTEKNQSKILFEQNRGQFDEQAKFVSRGKGATMFLTATEAIYVLPIQTEEISKSEIQNLKFENEIQRPKTEDQRPSKAFALKMEFVGANEAAEVSGVDEIETKTNYFRGNDETKWLVDVPNFSRVRYQSVYPNIDLEFYGNAENKSEYDFIVKPNADASNIELNFNGADSVEIDQTTGELLINTAAGTITQAKPITYQNNESGAKQSIESRYEIISANRVRFTVGEYDCSKPLVIDPTLSNLAFSTYLGGGGGDSVNGIKTDATGNVYVSGSTTSDLFPTTSGVYDATYNGGSDVFVSKLSADGGSLIYSTYIGGTVIGNGTGDDLGNSLAVDSTGSVYLTGYTSSLNFPTTGGAFDTTYNGNGDAFVTKLNANGNQLIYSTFLGGGSSVDIGSGIAVNQAGNAFITGYTRSTDFPTANAYRAYAGNLDAFVTKLNVSGTGLVYSTYLGGNGDDEGKAITVNAADEPIVTGETSGGSEESVFPTTNGAYSRVYGGGYRDAFVTKFYSVGSIAAFSTFLGGNGDDQGYAIATDSLGNIYLTGLAGDSFPTTGGAYNQAGGSDGQDIFATKINPSGNNLIYSTYIAGDGYDVGNGIAVDSTGAAYITGQTRSDDYPVTSDAYYQYYSSTSNTFVTKINAGGNSLNYSTYLGADDNSFGQAIALDSARNIYIGGTAAGEFPTTSNAFQTGNAGFGDGFVTKLGNYIISGKAVDTSGAAISNATIALSGSSSATAQTDANGKFIFLNALPNRAYTISASKTGTIFNPSLFNITNLNDNRDLIFVAGGSPSSGGTGANLSFSTSNYTVNESDNTATIRVWRGVDTANNSVSVNYATANGTATAGTDYTATNGTLTFAPGEVEKTFVVPVSDDVAVENSETVNLSLSNPTGGATLGTGSATLAINDNGEPQLQTSGYAISIVTSGGVFKGKHIAGLVADKTNGVIYVATDNNTIEPATGLTNNCGTQPDQTSFSLYRIAPGGTIVLRGNYPIPHRALVNLEINSADGGIYTVGTDRKVYRIDADGPMTIFNSDVGFDTTRYGLKADAEGNLILMRYGAPNSFYRVSNGTGATFLGSYADDSAANFGDRFAIQPDGDYVVFSDAPAQRNPRDFEIDTTGHADGTPFNFTYLSTTNVRNLGSAYINSNGAIHPASGDVYTSGGNCSAGSSVILQTPANNSLMLDDSFAATASTSVFISGIGNNFTDSADNYNARGVTALDFGARRDGGSGSCLYFADDYNDVIYQSCSFAPTAAGVSIGGRVTSGGKGLARARVTLTDQNGATRSTLTNMFGFYRFDEVPSGANYILSPTHSFYTFAPRAVSLTEAIDDFNFSTEP